MEALRETSDPLVAVERLLRAWALDPVDGSEAGPHEQASMNMEVDIFARLADSIGLGGFSGVLSPGPIAVVAATPGIDALHNAADEAAPPAKYTNL